MHQQISRNPTKTHKPNCTTTHYESKQTKKPKNLSKRYVGKRHIYIYIYIYICICICMHQQISRNPTKTHTHPTVPQHITNPNKQKNKKNKKNLSKRYVGKRHIAQNTQKFD